MTTKHEMHVVLAGMISMCPTTPTDNPLPYLLKIAARSICSNTEQTLLLQGAILSWKDGITEEQCNNPLIQQLLIQADSTYVALENYRDEMIGRMSVTERILSAFTPITSETPPSPMSNPQPDNCGDNDLDIFGQLMPGGD